MSTFIMHVSGGVMTCIGLRMISEHGPTWFNAVACAFLITGVQLIAQAAARRQAGKP